MPQIWNGDTFVAAFYVWSKLKIIDEVVVLSTLFIHTLHGDIQYIIQCESPIDL